MYNTWVLFWKLFAATQVAPQTAQRHKVFFSFFSTNSLFLNVATTQIHTQKPCWKLKLLNPKFQTLNLSFLKYYSQGPTTCTGNNNKNLPTCFLILNPILLSLELIPYCMSHLHQDATKNNSCTQAKDLIAEVFQNRKKILLTRLLWKTHNPSCSYYYSSTATSASQAWCRRHYDPRSNS